MALGGALGLAWSPVTPVTPRHFAWKAWHNLSSTFVLRGRRGTISHPPSFRVAGVALMALGGALGLAWSPVTPVTPVTPRHFACFCVAGVAQSQIHHRFAWQAWTLSDTIFHIQLSHTTLSTSIFHIWTGLVARDVRDVAALCVVGVAQSHIYRGFAWQSWHKLTSSTIVLRGRRCVASVAWHAWH